MSEIDIRDIPYGWQHLIDRIHGDLDALGTESVRLEFYGKLPETRLSIKIIEHIDREKLKCIQRIEDDFFELAERTCERCGRPGERIGLLGRRDRILCMRHVLTEDCD